MLDHQLRELPGGRQATAGAICCAVALGALAVGQAWGLAAAIVGLWQGGGLAAQTAWIALFCACFLLRRAVATAEDAAMERYAERIADNLRRGLLEAAWRGGPAFVRERGSAAVAASAMEGADEAGAYVRMMFPKAANVMFEPMVMLVALFWLDWVSGLIALACFPFMVLFMRLIGQSAGAEARGRYAQFEELSAGFTDIASGIETLRAFGAVERFAGRVFALSERFRELTMKTLRVAMLSTAVLDLFATLCLAGVAIMLGLRLVDGTMQFLPALCALMLVPEYFKPVREYGEDYHATLNGKAALEAILRMQRAAGTERSAAGATAALTDERAAEELSAAESEHGGARAAQPHPAKDGHPLPMDAPPEELLRLLGLRAGASGCTGVVGPSGAGKTTLLNGIAGLAGARCGAWVRRVAYLPQDPYIFRASLRENVTFYAPDASDAQVREALEAVGLSAFADGLPEGLATRIGDGARELSGGQAQRVAVARALLDPARDLWLLDEPTAHLDAATETELIACLQPLMAGRTVVVATHSAAWLPCFDACFRIESGRLSAVAPEEAL